MVGFHAINGDIAILENGMARIIPRAVLLFFRILYNEDILLVMIRLEER